MKAPDEKNDIIRSLQKEILSLQGLVKTPGSQVVRTGLGMIEAAFPDSIFPTGAIHEFLSYQPEEAAAANGFIAGLLCAFMKRNGFCLWISTRRTIFPPVLKLFGIPPDRVIFIDAAKNKDALWTIEEALKCNTLSVVVGELNELSFKESRRLQLAVEQSRVTGLIHRYRPRTENPVAAVARWRIQPLAGIITDGVPGVGAPHWQVELQKVRNGKPGSWQLAWLKGRFQLVETQTATTIHLHSNLQYG